MKHTCLRFLAERFISLKLKSMKKFSLLAAVVLLTAAGCSHSDDVTEDPTTDDAMQTVVHEMTFVDHLDAQLPEQDVYLLDETGDTKVIRVTDDARADEMVYAAKEMVEHDPFQVGENPLGPFDKGNELGFTLKDWLSATATGTYTVEGDKASLEIEAEGLVPNGVYTVWCSHIYMPPNPKIKDYPCGADDGSESVATADAEGNLSYSLESMDVLPETKETDLPILALSYHSDGETYGADPGEFGKAAHIQLFYMMPAEL